LTGSPYPERHRDRFVEPRAIGLGFGFTLAPSMNTGTSGVASQDAGAVICGTLFRSGPLRAPRRTARPGAAAQQATIAHA